MDAYVLGLLLISISESSSTMCDFQLSESEGRISTNESLSGQCPTSIYHLSNFSGILLAKVDVVSSHRTRNCEQALDKVFLPEGSECCFMERICRIYFEKELKVSELSPRIKKRIQRKCNVTWTELKSWPPTFKIKKHFTSFKAFISYQFQKLVEPKSRSFEAAVPIKEKTIDYKMAALIPGVIGFLLLAAGAGFIIYRRKKQNDPNSVYDIAPYAIHVSLRRRSENPFNYYNHPASANHYDVPPPTEPENEYLRPMKESPYYEIDEYANCKPAPPPQTEDVYTMASPVPEAGYDIPRTFHTFLSKSEMFLNSDMTEPSISASRRPLASSPQFNRCNLSKSEGDLSGGRTDYGEIIGFINEDGKMERFEPCKDTYKSIRKNR